MIWGGGPLSKLKLYFAPGSCALAALACLEAAEAEYDAQPVLLSAGEQRKPEFLALSPRGQVPVLEVDGQAIRENIAVLTYIAHRFPAARLLPLDQPLHLAKAYEMLSWFATNLHVAVAQVWRGERFTDDEEVKAGLKRDGVLRMRRALETFNTLAERPGPYLYGHHFSALDPLAIVASRWARRMEIDLADYPAFKTLAGQVEVHPAMVRAVEREQAA
jgi:glutathione S-transferase